MEFAYLHRSMKTSANFHPWSRTTESRKLPCWGKTVSSFLPIEAPTLFSDM
uniref:Uncharacterized protein n=1 Tax=Anguilla anguilla TaxID=7936 RepID=A0A0E9W5I5_ANGAN